eukprot:1199116-Alexandrium_andersonii.AAC.1
MSASLVGSEMCIRDRSPITCQPLLRNGMRVGRAYGDGICIVVVNGSVSYTHLTLPTICSV